MRLFTLTFAFVLGVGVLACASESVRLDAVGPDGRLGHEARYVIERSGSHQGMVILESSGLSNDTEAGHRMDTVRFRVIVNNTCDAPISLALDRLIARDDRGNLLPLVRSIRTFGDTGPLFTVAPLTRSSMELLFDAGAPGALRTTGGMTLSWAYHLGDTDVDHATRFLPVRYVGRDERVTYVGVGENR